MKALSIINPWAHLIMYHGKNIENRSWRTDYRGRLLIHVSKKLMIDYKFLISDLKSCCLLDKEKFQGIEGEEEFKQIEAECGMILGSVVLYACELGQYNVPWGEIGQWHWKLRDPIVFEKPIPARGSLGLWEYIGEA